MVDFIEMKEFEHIWHRSCYNIGAMKYRFSFTAVGLASVATQEVAALFRESGSWDAVYKRVVRENTLGCRTESALKRIGSELVHRLGALSSEEVDRFVENRLGERNLFAWLAICRYYEMIGDFAVEALHEAYVSGQKTFTHTDYARFVNAKLSLHPELDQVSDQTFAKMRQIIFKMMTEAGFLDGEQNIIPVVMDKDLANFIPKRDFAFFPMFIGGK